MLFLVYTEHMQWYADYDSVVKSAAEFTTSKFINETWTVYKKHKQNNWTSIIKERKKEEKYEQFLSNFLNQHDRFSNLQNENFYMK